MEIGGPKLVSIVIGHGLGMSVQLAEIGDGGSNWERRPPHFFKIDKAYVPTERPLGVFGQENMLRIKTIVSEPRVMKVPNLSANALPQLGAAFRIKTRTGEYGIQVPVLC